MMIQTKGCAKNGGGRRIDGSTKARGSSSSTSSSSSCSAGALLSAACLTLAAVSVATLPAPAVALQVRPGGGSARSFAFGAGSANSIHRPLVRTTNPLFQSPYSSHTDITHLEKSNKKRTLYDVLGADPSYTKAQLKRRYVALARMYHPDSRPENALSPTAAAEFSEIAAAWNVLSDSRERRRYDRGLQAEQFSKDVQNVAGAIARQLLRNAKMLGRIAVPLLRRTAQAAAGGFKNAAAASSRGDDDNVEAQGRRSATAATTDATGTSFQAAATTAPASASAATTDPAMGRAVGRMESLGETQVMNPPPAEEDEGALGYLIGMFLMAIAFIAMS